MVRVIDNSGAAWIKCFNVIRSRKNVARIGDIIVASVREAHDLEETKANSKVQKVSKGDVVRALVVRTKKETRRSDGTYIRFDDNACVLVDIDPKKGVIPRGTRITGVVAQELQKKNYSKILSLAPAVV